MSILQQLARHPPTRDFARRWVPQVLREWINWVSGHAITYQGTYPDWESATAATTGYDDDALIERLIKAARACRQRPGYWEQDGVVYSAIPPDFPLFYAMLLVAAKNTTNRLCILDIGGGLASSYYQCRHYFPPELHLDWRIVEQPRLVIAGREFPEKELRYFDSLDAALSEGRPDIVLMSSVLQYLREPYVVLEQICASGIPYAVIDRHPFSFTRELITVQVIPKTLYPASYPSWLFDQKRFFEVIDRTYDRIAEWRGKDPPIRGRGLGAEFHGLLLRRRVSA